MIRFITISATLIYFTSALAQNVGDCAGGIVMCDNFYSEVNAPVGFGTVQEFVGDCNFGLSGETNSVWYIFTAQTSGAMGFVLQANNINDDYDWAVLDITDGGCAGINSMTSPVVSCNSFGITGVNGPTGISTANGGTGNTNGPGDLNGPPFNADLNVQAGDTYAIAVMNWTGSANGYTLDFSGSTASLFDDIPPTITSVEIDCANQIVTATFSENLMFNSIQPVDFQLTGPQGTINVSAAAPQGGIMSILNLTLGAQITQSGSYQLTILPDQAFVTDGCGNEATEPFTFDVFEPMTFTASSEVACNGTNGSVTVSDISGGAAPHIFLLGGVAQLSFETTGLDAGFYAVSVSDSVGCVLTQQVEVQAYNLILNIQDQDTLSCIQPSTSIQGLTLQPNDPAEFEWITADGNILSNSDQPNPTVDTEGIYNVTVTIVENGCTAQLSAEISAEDEANIEHSALLMPNVLTADGDSINDVWTVLYSIDPELDLSLIISEFDLMIFNRWGTEVYKDSTFPMAWKPEAEQGGNYFVTLRYRTYCDGDKDFELQQTVQLLR